MTSDIHRECAVCAWRANCGKKYRLEEVALHCGDFTRDLALEPADGAKKEPERHKKVDDVFSRRR